jgi:hypothetical protein
MSPRLEWLIQQWLEHLEPVQLVPLGPVLRERMGQPSLE